MTTMTKKAKKPGNATTRRVGKKTKRSQLPPTADVASIAGKEFVIMPLEDFEEWQDDMMLTALVTERLEDGEAFIPFEEIEARLDQRKKRRKK